LLIDDKFVHYNSIKIDYEYIKYIFRPSDQFGYPTYLYLDLQDEETKEFKYKILPDFCNEFIPNQYNFEIICFPENLSKLIENDFKPPKDCKRYTKEKENLSTLKLKSKEGNIYTTWIIMWCLTFKYCNNVEKLYRVNQMNAVLNIFKEKVPEFKKWDIVFEEVLQVIQRNGDIKMIIKVMQMMKCFDVKFTLITYQIFFDSLYQTGKYARVE
jgi:hypothetical protein